MEAIEDTTIEEERPKLFSKYGEWMLAQKNRWRRPNTTRKPNITNLAKDQPPHEVTITGNNQNHESQGTTTNKSNTPITTSTPSVSYHRNNHPKPKNLASPYDINARNTFCILESEETEDTTTESLQIPS